MHLILLLVAASFAQQTIETVAGGGTGDAVAATAKSLSITHCAAFDTQQRVHFCAQNRIYRIEANGSLTVVAGTGGAGFSGDGGPAPRAELTQPQGIVFDSLNRLWIADTHNHRVRRVDSDGTIHTIVGNGTAAWRGDGGAAMDASLNYPRGLAFDRDGRLLIADTFNHMLRRVDPDGVITSIAGVEAVAGFSGDSEAAVDAQLYFPSALALDSSGALLIADTGNHRIRKIDTAGIINTIAGTGAAEYGGDGRAAAQAQLQSPTSVALDASGNLWIADQGNHRIRRIAANGNISTVAGTGTLGFSGEGGQATSAQLYHPCDVAVDRGGNVVFADSWNQRLRRIANNNITTIAGNGGLRIGGDNILAIATELNTPTAAVQAATGELYIADSRAGRVRRVGPDGVITTIAGSAEGLGEPVALALAPDGTLYIADAARHRVFRWLGGRLESMLGAGTAGNSLTALAFPSGLAVDAEGLVYVADSANHRILRFRPGSTATVFAGTGTPGLLGDGGPAIEARFNTPMGLAFDVSGRLWIADLYNGLVRRIDPDQRIQTVIDGLNFPTAVAASDRIWVAEYGAHRLAEWIPAANTLTIRAGNGFSGFSGDGGAPSAAQLNLPQGISVAPNGDLLIADSGNHRVRRIR